MKKVKGRSFPTHGLEKELLLDQMKSDKQNDLNWKEGKAFCLVYYPWDDKADLVKQAYQLYFSENALNPMSFPSLRRYETDVVSMVTELLHGDSKTCGTLTSGGTESILLAIKTARDYMRKVKPNIKVPEIILPTTAHPAFEKACHYFSVNPIYIPVDEEYRANILEVNKVINDNTIMLVGSAPSYPQGVIDPIDKLSVLARKHHILLHVDACIGGFILPFMKKLNYPVKEFDFNLKGVTSISVDLHKYGYAAKGASVILYRNHELRKSQFFVSTSWPGGIYASSSIAGTRPGGAIAAAYAAIVGIGEEGYLQMTKETMEVTDKIKKAIEEVKELRLMCRPDASILAFDSKQIDVYDLADELNILGWHFERLQNPKGLHLTINHIHTKSVDQFIDDLKKCVEIVKCMKVNQIAKSIKLSIVKGLSKILPEGTLARIQSKFSGKVGKSERTAPMYGMMGALRGSEDLNLIVLGLLDKLNTVE